MLHFVADVAEALVRVSPIWQGTALFQCKNLEERGYLVEACVLLSGQHGAWEVLSLSELALNGLDHLD